MKRPAPTVQQRLDVGNQAGAADTAKKKKLLHLNFKQTMYSRLQYILKSGNIDYC